jgi:hypothetical protein
MKNAFDHYSIRFGAVRDEVFRESFDGPEPHALVLSVANLGGRAYFRECSKLVETGLRSLNETLGNIQAGFFSQVRE